MTIELNDAALRAVFLQEAEEGLETMEQALLALEAHPDDPEAINEVFRIAHTIKGGASMVEWNAVAELSHRFEDVLVMMRDGVVPVTPARVTIMLQVVDALRTTIAAQASGQAVQLRASDVQLVTRLIPVELHAAPEPTSGIEYEPMGASAMNGGNKGATAKRSLRVDMAKLDALLTLSGEIAVAKGRVLQVLAAETSSETSVGAGEELARLLASLHEQVMEMRLVPVGPLFRQHQRTVRDIAANQSKLVRLVLTGEDVALDATIVEQLRDPLTHIVRNAVDHGVEFPMQRRDAGKDLCATVELHARHERGAVIIEIKDDGKGMHRANILARAKERGLVQENDQLTDAQVLALTMAPGLSTAASVTEVSGRGVGMDVVRRSIEALRGSIELESVAGQGTTVRLRLPLTVAIIEGFAVGVADERYVIPVGSVTECVTAADAAPDVTTGVLPMRGTALPFVRLRQLLGASPRETRVDKSAHRESIVIVEADGRKVGLVVDDLYGETQAVISPLAEMFRGVHGVSGSTILADGRVSLILDIPSLVALAH
jgi:two-component system chemotaxis sensor kinase CheA